LRSITPLRRRAVAAGTVDEAQRIGIGDHVRGCARRCRTFVGALEHVGGVVLETLPLTPLTDGSLAKVMAQLEQLTPSSWPRPLVVRTMLLRLARAARSTAGGSVTGDGLSRACVAGLECRKLPLSAIERLIDFNQNTEKVLLLTKLVSAVN
jgi:hypothetical protein